MEDIIAGAAFSGQKEPRPIPESYWVIEGRLLAGEYPCADIPSETTRKRLDAFLQAGFDCFINLTCEGEAQDYEQIVQEQAGYYNMAVECLRFPIGDFGLPTVPEMTRILDTLEQRLGQGRKVYLHCYGGIGRTGTTVGCLLVRHGLTGEQALQRLGNWWRMVPKSRRFPASPETSQQTKFVREWSRAENGVADL